MTTLADSPLHTPQHPLREFWDYFSTNKGAVAGLIIVLVVLLMAAFAPLIAPYPPDATDSTVFLTPPAWQAGGSSAHLLGTDAIGRDILSRLIFGARLSLAIGLAVVALSVIVGTVLGLTAGYFRGVFEVAVMRLMDIMLALPSLLLAQKSLARSIQLAPDFVPALSELARTKTLEWLERGSADRALLREATHLAERGHRYDPLDSSSLREIGHAALYQHDLASALEHFDAALELAPNHADLLVDQADVLTHMSRHVEAETLITRALALNPLAPDDYYWIGGAVSFFRERYQEAIDRLTAMRSPGLALRLLAASAAMNGDLEEARRYRDQVLERDPSFTVAKWASLYPEPNRTDTAHYLQALRMAGFS